MCFVLLICSLIFLVRFCLRKLENQFAYKCYQVPHLHSIFQFYMYVGEKGFDIVKRILPALSPIKQPHFTTIHKALDCCTFFILSDSLTICILSCGQDYGLSKNCLNWRLEALALGILGKEGVFSSSQEKDIKSGSHIDLYNLGSGGGVIHLINQSTGQSNQQFICRILYNVKKKTKNQLLVYGGRQ